jgi:hypothetical protein
MPFTWSEDAIQAAWDATTDLVSEGDIVAALNAAAKADGLIESVTLQERERCAKIVEQWPIETHYIVQKQRLKERRQAIAAAIRDNKDGK